MILSITIFSIRTHSILEKRCYAVSFMLTVLYVACHYAECHSAECHSAECHSAACHYAERNGA